MPALPEGELTRRFLVNTLSTGALRVASALAGLWAARQLVDALGREDFGLVTLSSALAGYLAFMGLGLPAGLVRQVARYRGQGLVVRLRRLVGFSLLLFAAVGLVACLALIGFATLGGIRILSVRPESVELTRAVVLATAAVVLVSWPLSVFSATLTGLQKYPALNSVTGLGLLSAAVVSVAVARAGGGAAGVVLATGAVMAVAGLAHAFIVRRELVDAPPAVFSGDGVREELRPLLAFGMWTLALELAALLIYQTDQVLLGIFVSIESLTVYYVVARLHNLLREANGVLGSALFPLIAEEHGRGNPAAVPQAVYRGTRYSAAILIPATVAVILLARPFLSVWMGESFSVWAPLAQVYASYFLLAVLTSFPAQVGLGLGESAVVGKIALGAALVNLCVSLALVRSFGVMGVIAGTLVAYALAVPIQFAWLFPRIGIDRSRFVREVVVPVYGVMIPAGALWWAVLRRLPDPRGVVSLAGVGALIVGSCWLTLWFVAVERRDRERVLASIGRALGRRVP